MLSFRIALRYVLALRKFSTTQILSLLAFLGIFLGSMAMVVVLSAFNGFEGLLKEIYHSQDPDLKIETIKGKTFQLDSNVLQKLRTLEGVKGVYQSLADKASLQYGDGQMVVQIVGIEKGFENASRLDTLVRKGKFIVSSGDISFGMVTEPVRNALKISLNNDFEFLKVSYPKRKKILKLGTNKIFNQLNLTPSGFLQMDEQRVYAPLEDVRVLMDKPLGISFLDVFIAEGSNIQKVKNDLLKTLGSGFLVKDEMEQHEDLFKILKIEKFFVFLALGFIILISSFNLFVSCSMLVLDKKNDIFTLLAMGMKPNNVGRIVRISGGLVTILGLIPGLLFGLAICLIQKWFGLVPLGMSSTTIMSYPIDIQWFDFLLVSLWVMVIGFFAVINPAKKALIFTLDKS